jgi:hypothetical protein
MPNKSLHSLAHLLYNLQVKECWRVVSGVPPCDQYPQVIFVNLLSHCKQMCESSFTFSSGIVLTSFDATKHFQLRKLH